MKNNAQEIIRRIRASKIYSEWVDRNRAAACIRCGSTENVTLHHIESLYHSIADHHKFYGDWDEAYNHVLIRHQSDLVSAATLCDRCHAASHPGRRQLSIDTTTVDRTLWLAAPRTPLPRFAPRRAKHGHIGLLAFQTMLCIGNHIVCGRMRDRILTIEYSDFARIADKQNGTALKAGLQNAAITLEHAAIVSGHYAGQTGIEYHLQPGYIEQLITNPWFIHYKEGQGSGSLTVFLRWLLSFLPNRRRYAIGVEKMAQQLGSDDTNPHRFAARVCEAAGQIPWVTGTEVRDGLIHFKMKKRTTAPVFPLRKILTENANDGK